MGRGVRVATAAAVATLATATALVALPASAATDTEVTPAASGVTASADDGNVPANTVDGNLGTRWSAQGDGQWIRYDLGRTQIVTRVQVAVYQGNTRRNSFDLQVSADGSAWHTVWSGQSNGTTTGLVSYDIPDSSSRYVRYLGHGNSVNAWNSLTEVEIYATVGTGSLVWTADGNVNGLKAFEGCEVPDNSSVTHVYIDNGNYHVLSLKGDDDSAIGTTERSRTECKGMIAGDAQVHMVSGQTWRFGWDLYIPTTLQGTDHFTHLAQIKAVGVDNVDHPIATLTVYRPAGEVLEVRTANSDTSGDQHLNPIDLNLVRGKWIHTEWEIRIAGSGGGYVRWTLRDADGAGTNVYVNGAQLTGLTTWRTDSSPSDNRLRPKWGIYRYVKDVTPSTAIQNTYLLIRHIQAVRVS
jgi:hypothetical protein